MNMQERFGQLPVFDPDAKRPRKGLYLNDMAFRIEYWDNGLLKCWMQMRDLVEFGRKSDAEIRELIELSPEPRATMLRNICQNVF